MPGFPLWRKHLRKEDVAGAASRHELWLACLKQDQELAAGRRSHGGGIQAGVADPRNRSNTPSRVSRSV
ncbi:hypothetical protein J2W94_002213 [Pseudoxanthomonas sacheonensis]|uniref:Uncharacterized protein n=1 Tax=Pseudoxanthomonas sacheonensis TaxID=443615 RepID=A0ABU1RT33_9GAMM|nr:hypothetical protein [Pseudoxanthomonas sacheonensis]